MNISAVLINYRGAHDITQAVRSILADAPGIDIVVVDNSDDPQEWIRLDELLPPSVRRVRAPGNLGFGQGCNLAMEQTDAPYVFLVNPDVRLVPGCTAKLLHALEADPALAAVAPRQFLDPECQWHMPPAWLPTSVRAWVHEKAMREPGAALRVGRAARAENLRLWTAHAPVRQRALSGAVVMLRRSCLHPGELLFDPRFFMYFEDSDLCTRLRRRGATLAMVPAARAVHAWRNLPHKAELMAEGARVFFDKYYPDDRAWLHRSRNMGPVNPLHTALHLPVASLRSVPVPPQWHSGWLLELSPSPLIQPAIGMLGSGSLAQVAEATLACFECAQVFARLGGVSKVDGDCKLFSVSPSQ